MENFFFGSWMVECRDFLHQLVKLSYIIVCTFLGKVACSGRVIQYKIHSSKKRKLYAIVESSSWLTIMHKCKEFTHTNEWFTMHKSMPRRRASCIIDNKLLFNHKKGSCKLCSNLRRRLWIINKQVRFQSCSNLNKFRFNLFPKHKKEVIHNMKINYAN